MGELRLTGGDIYEVTGWPDLTYWVTVFGVALAAVVMLWVALKLTVYGGRRYGYWKLGTVLIIGLLCFTPTILLLESGFSAKTTEWSEETSSGGVNVIAGNRPIPYHCQTVALSVIDHQQLWPEFQDKLVKGLTESGLFEKIYVMGDSASLLNPGEIDQILTVALADMAVIEQSTFKKQLSYQVYYKFEHVINADEYNEDTLYSINTNSPAGELSGKATIGGICSLEDAKEVLQFQVMKQCVNEVCEQFSKANDLEPFTYQTKVFPVTPMIDDKTVDLIIPEHWQFVNHWEAPGIRYAKRHFIRYYVKPKDKESLFNACRQLLVDNGFDYKIEYKVNPPNKLNLSEAKIENPRTLFGWGHGTCNKDGSVSLKVKYMRAGEVNYQLGNDPLVDGQDYFITLELYDRISDEELGTRIKSLAEILKAKEKDALLYSLTQTYYQEGDTTGSEAINYLVKKEPDNLAYRWQQAELAEGLEKIKFKKAILADLTGKSQYYGDCLHLERDIAEVENALVNE